jgi:regulator of replication initiation timing
MEKIMINKEEKIIIILERLVEDVSSLKEDVSSLKKDVNILKEVQKDLIIKVDMLDLGQKELREDVDGHQKVLVLTLEERHENLIKALSDGYSLNRDKISEHETKFIKLENRVEKNSNDIFIFEI